MIHDFPAGAVFKIVSSVMASIAVDVLKNEVSIWGVGLAFNRIKDILFKKILKKNYFTFVRLIVRGLRCFDRPDPSVCCELFISLALLGLPENIIILI